MTETMALDVMGRSIWATLISSMPALLAALAVGVAVGMLQAATSIQEQTLVFIPKIVVVLLVLVLLGPWIFSVIEGYTVELLSRLPEMAPR